jgi:hypothetical protein
MLVAWVDMMLEISLVVFIFSSISVCYIKHHDVLVRWVVMFIFCMIYVCCVHIIVVLTDYCHDYFPSFKKYIIIIIHIALVMCHMLS